MEVMEVHDQGREEQREGQFQEPTLWSRPYGWAQLPVKC